MQLTLREVCEAVTLPGGPSGDVTVQMNTVVSGYSIDSRTLKPGELFFAIHGPHFDGHDFVRQALERGACGAIVAAEWEARQTDSFRLEARNKKWNLVVVEQPPQALQELASRVRGWWGGQLIAITGSAGKTTTKEICAELVGIRKRVYKSEGNLNNLYGVPLTLLRIEAGAEVAVLELAMSAASEIRKLAQIARPNIGVVTNVNPVHLQFFKSIDEIALAKRELVEELEETAVAVLNLDDQRVAGFKNFTRARTVTFGETRGANVHLLDIRASDLNGSQFDVALSTGDRATCRLNLLGKHNVWNAAAAIAAAWQLGLSLEEMARGLELVRPTKMRGEVLRFEAGFTVVNDTYNSNPRALKEVVDTMTRIPGFQRKIVVAGEMLELGSESKSLHADCGKVITGAGIDILLAVQGDAAAMADAARLAGMNSDRVFFFDDPVQAGEELCRLVAPGDLVLLKGSRGVRMETALEILRRKFSLEAN